MSNPIILSDDEDQLTTPIDKKQKIEFGHNNPSPSSIFVIDDDFTPQKPKNSSSPTPSPLIVPETPMSDVAIVKCTNATSRVSVYDNYNNQRFSGISGLICLESDNESEGGLKKANGKENEDENEINSGFDSDGMSDSEPSSKILRPTSSVDTSAQFSGGSSIHPISLENIYQDYSQTENVGTDDTNVVPKKKGATKVSAEKGKGRDDGQKKTTKEERMRLMEEKKLRKEEEKLRKAALKAEAAEARKLEKEKKKWESGKLALKSIVAKIDTKVIEMGSVGGHMLSRLAEKGLTYRVKSNPVERSIVWTMTVPEQISQLSSDGIEIPYVLLVYEAEEFCNLVTNQSLMDHASGIQSRYPSSTISYVTYRLMSYLYKREQEQYKNPANGWKRPPVEEVLAKLTTNFFRVHSRQCIDEAELAEHVVGLTCSLAACQFRKKLTRLSVNANGAIIPKDSVDRNLINKNLWLKALVAMPKVQPRFAIAIWKKYPTMKSLLCVYMDPSKTVHEKEFLLKDLTTEGLLGEDRRLGEMCSKRVYRILMAQSGSIKTDDVELGADFFQS